MEAGNSYSTRRAAALTSWAMKADRSRQKPLALPDTPRRAARQPSRAEPRSLRKPLLIDYQSWMALTNSIAKAAAAADRTS